MTWKHHGYDHGVDDDDDDDDEDGDDNDDDDDDTLNPKPKLDANNYPCSEVRGAPWQGCLRPGPPGTPSFLGFKTQRASGLGFYGLGFGVLGFRV